MDFVSGDSRRGGCVVMPREKKKMPGECNKTGGGKRPVEVAAGETRARRQRPSRMLDDTVASRGGKGRAPARLPQSQDWCSGRASAGRHVAICHEGPTGLSCLHLGGAAAGAAGEARDLANVSMSRCGSPRPGAAGGRQTAPCARWCRCTAGRHKGKSAQLGPEAGVAGFALLCCFLAALPIVSDADKLQLQSHTEDIDRQAVRGELFRVQPRLWLYNEDGDRLERAGVRVEAHCSSTAGSCVVDCGTSVRASQGSCFAVSDDEGEIRFTDLMLLDESIGIYTIELIQMNNISSAVAGRASFDLFLDGGTALVAEKNYGLKTEFYDMTTNGEGRLETLAGVPFGRVEVSLLDGLGQPVRYSRKAIFAELVPHASAINLPIMYAQMMPLCVTESEWKAYCGSSSACLKPNGEPIIFPPACNSPGFPSEYVRSPFPITCCQHSDCTVMPMPGDATDRCCECSRPECTLCQTPAMGRVEFRFDFRRKGTFGVVFKYKSFDEQTLFATCTDGSGSGALVFTQPGCVSDRWTDKSYLPAEIIAVKANVPVDLTVATHPGPFYIGTITGDEMAVITPAPRVYFQDAFSNFAALQEQAQDEIAAMLCYDGTAPAQEGVAPRGLCRCDALPRCATLQANAPMPVLSGKTKSPVENNNSESGVVFTELYTYVARSDLRLYFQHVKRGQLSSLNVTSQSFRISAGALQSIALPSDSDRSLVGGCPRCPNGVYLAGVAVRVSVTLLDTYNNTLAYCHPLSPFCVAHSSHLVIAQVSLSSSETLVTGTALAPDSVTEAVSAAGRAVFSDIRISRAGSGYSLRFVTSNQIGGFITAQTPVFTVTAGWPTKIAAVQTRQTLLAADAEYFLVQPHIEYLDAFENRVVNHCYTNCGGTLTGFCNLTQTPCMAHAQVSVDIDRRNNLRNNPSFEGTKIVVANNGLAVFTDLKIDLFGEGSTRGSGTACACNQISCPSCSTCYNDQYPLENVILIFTTRIDDVVLAAQQTVQIAHRVQKLLIKNQPTDNEVQVVAQDFFINPVVLQALSCDDQLVTTAVATCKIAIRDSPARAEIFGTKTEPLVGSFFTFTNLLLDLPGSYTLQFAYAGNAVVETVFSSTFDVSNEVHRLQILSSPENTTNVAGIPFSVQPKVRLVDRFGVIALGSSKPVTASIGTDPGSTIPHLPGPSTLYGQVAVPAVRGSASFMDLMIQKASVGQGSNFGAYTLQFSHASMRAVSMEFFVVPNKWVDLHVPFYTQPLTSVAGQPLARQPHVFLVDQFTNRILPSQVPLGTRILASIVERIEYFPGNPARLLRHGCNEVCTGGQVPIICRTCPDVTLSAAAGWVRYTDLRIDIEHGEYHLLFNTTDGEGNRLTAKTQTFSVTPGKLEGLLSNDFERKLYADKNLVIQPQIQLTDLYGNRVRDVSLLKDGIVHVRLVTVGGQLPVAPPMQPVSGQTPGSVCNVYPSPLRGNVKGNISTGIAEFTDLAIRQAMTQYRLEFHVATQNDPLIRLSRNFDVVAGEPVRLCNMSLPDRCNQLSDCVDLTEIVCVDAYGNVQEQCKVCRSGMPVDGRCTDNSNEGLAENWDDACPLGKVCAQLVSPTYADGASETPSIISTHTCGKSPNPSVPCASVSPKSGPYGALFTSLKFPYPSADYVVRFYTYLADPAKFTGKIILEYVTPEFSVFPTRPKLQLVTFSETFVELFLQFDRITNKRPKLLGPPESCDEYLAPEFIETLGTPLTCRWASSTRLIAYLGVNASVGPFTRVLLSPRNTIMHMGTYNGYEMTSSPATTDVRVFIAGVPLQPVYPQISATVAVPKPVTMGVQNIGACELLKIDARASTGNAGRPFSEIKWGLHFDRTYNLDGILGAKDTPIFINRFIDFSSLLPGEVNTVTVRLRPNADVTQGSIITIHGLPGHSRRASGCVPEEKASESPPPFVPCISKFQTKQHMSTFPQTNIYFDSRCIDVPLRGPGAKYFELNGSIAGTGVPAAQWYDGPNGVELHIRVLGMRADKMLAGGCPRKANPDDPGDPRMLDCTQCNCAAYLPAGKVTEFEFDMVNPHMATTSRRLMIESNCDEYYYACKPEFGVDKGGPYGPMNWIRQENEMQLNCGRSWNEGAACRDTVIFGLNDFDIRLVSGNISETTALLGAKNTLTVTVVPSTGMPAGSRILLRGLEGSATESGAVCLHSAIDLRSGQQLIFFNCKECSFGMPFGEWIAESGSLAVTIKNGSLVTEAGIAFSFDLYNADRINRGRCADRDILKCPSVARPEILLLSPARHSGAYTSLPGNVLGSGFEPRILTANVAEGNSLKGHLNLLVFEFSTNVKVSGGSVVTIWTDSAVGLGRTINNGVDHFVDPNERSCWGFRWHARGGFATADGEYVIGAISLTVSSKCSVPANTRSAFAIRALNTNTETASPSIFINITSSSCKLCVDNCACGRFDSPDMVLPNFPVQGSILRSNKVANFVHAVAKESSTVRRQQNTLEVEFQSTFDAIALEGEQTQLTVSGLAGLSTPSGTMDVNIRVESQLPFSTTGFFDAQAGNLTFGLPASVPALTRVYVSFLVQNGATAQEPRRLGIQASTSSALCGGSIREICQILGMGLAKSSPNPVHVPHLVTQGSVLGFAGSPRLTTATIRELSRVNNAFNILTVHVRANFLISSPASISVSNLLGTRWPAKVANTQINLVRRFSDLLPNCSCSSCEPELTCLCDDSTLILYQTASAFLWTPEDKRFFGPLTSQASLVKGSWSPTTGLLSLDVAPGIEIQVGDDIVFSFAVQNPDFIAYSPRVANVTVTTQDFHTTTFADGLVLGAAAAPGFSVFEVSETSTVAGEFNEIFIAVESNFPMMTLQRNPGQLILRGMKGFSTPGGYMPIFGSQAFGIAKTGYGNWSIAKLNEPAEFQLTSGVMMCGCSTVGGEESCALKVPGVFDYTALGTQRFSYILQNTLLLNAGDNPLRIQYISDEIKSPDVASVSPPIGRALEPAKVEHVQLTESSVIRRVENEITLRIRFNVLLAPTSSMTLKGFKGSLTTSGTLALAGPDGPLFAAQFDGQNGAIVFELSANSDKIPAQTDIEIKFMLLNPVNKQDAPFFTVEARLIPPRTQLPDRSTCAARTIWYFGDEMRVPSTLIRGTKLFQAGEPLAFITKSIRESTMVNWAVNNISVVLESPARLPVDTVITLSGLVTPIPSKESLPIMGPTRDAFYFAGKKCGFEKGIQIKCTSTAAWDSGTRELQLRLTRDILPGQRIEISFLFRNRGCNRDCGGFLITISATGPSAASYVVFEPRHMDGAVMGAGVEHLSWIRKTVTQEHLVKSAPNRVKFSFRPNAPLYAGTEIAIEGIIGSQSTTCRSCRPPESLEGLGCDADCDDCKPQPIPNGGGAVFKPCLPVYRPVSDTLIKHEKFEPNSPWFATTGSLTLKVKKDQFIPQDEDTEVVLVLLNDICARKNDICRAGLHRADCTPGNTPQDVNSPSKCMTIRARSTILCNVVGEFGDQCAKPEGATIPDPASMDVGTKAIDAYGNPLVDRNPVIVRDEDFYVIQKTIEVIPNLLLDNVRVDVPSLRGAPTLKTGVLQAGSYSLFVNLTNWLNKTAIADFDFTKAHPPEGSGKGVLANENPKPRLMIEGPSQLTINRDQALILNARGQPIDCYPHEKDSLAYTWRVQCEDFNVFTRTYAPTSASTTALCTLPPVGDKIGMQNIEKMVQSRKVPDLVINSNSTIPGVKYTFVCDVSQHFIGSTAKVTIEVSIRPPVVKIEGVNRGGYVRSDLPLTLTARNSYDPEQFTTGLSSADFHFSWGCKELKTYCTLPPQLCPPLQFVDCEQYWMDSPQGHTITTNGSYFRPGWIYQIHVNATRDGSKLINKRSTPDSQIFAALPAIEKDEAAEAEDTIEVIQTYDDLILDPRWLNRAKGMVEFNTLPAEGIPVLVTVALCDPRQLGTASLCKSPVAGKVNPGSKLVLQASGKSQAGGVIIGYHWQIESEQEALSEDMILTSRTGPLLILKPNVLSTAADVKFTVRLQDSDGNFGVASMNVVVNQPPTSGSLTVQPPTGVALSTLFRMEAFQWETAAENLPLEFNYFYLLQDATTTQITLGRGMSTTILLPAGNASAGYILRVGVDVSDAHQTSTSTTAHVTVTLASSATQLEGLVNGAMQKIDDLLQQRSHREILGLVGSISQTINQAADVCTGDVKAECISGEECCKRQAVKLLLFLKLQQCDSNMDFAASKVATLVNVMKTVSARPQEISFDLVREMSRFMKEKFEELKRPEIQSAVNDAKSLADGFSVVLEALVSRAKVIIPTKVQVPYTLLGQHHESGARLKPQAPSLRERRDGITIASARGVVTQLLELISETSRLSVQDAEVGHKPVVIRRPNFVLNTSLLDLATFTAEYVAETEVGGGFHATLPSDLFKPANIKQPIFTASVVEIMLAVFEEPHNPLPGAKGPTLILEPRERGKVKAIEFEEALTKAVRIKMPFSNLSTNLRPGDEFNGFRLTPFGKYFDFKAWKWSAEGLTRRKLGDKYIDMESTHLSVFAASEVWAGCDDVPRSGKFFDHCGVCGGTNSTCSGCDGIPNTGRDKGCSGHGECNYVYEMDRSTGLKFFVPEKSKCSCAKEYYNDMCSVRCQEAIHCSGHGLCAENGDDCMCNRGWSTKDKLSGVFCDKAGAAALAVGAAEGDPNEGKLETSAVRQLIILGVAVLVGVIVFCALLYYVITYRRRQRESIQKTVIEFPQPQLEISAENRNDTNVMVPDETGWTNFQLPKATATFSYGPNSGQLASAVAASTRASLGQMSTERIDRRTTIMRKQVNKRTSTVNKYKIEGPMGPMHEDFDLEVENDDKDKDNLDDKEAGWFLTQPPEWLPQLPYGDTTSGTDGTPSPDEEVAV